MLNLATLSELILSDRFCAVEDAGPHVPCERNPEVLDYWRRYSPADDGFGCFAGDYAAIAEHLRTIPAVTSVTDIGCAWGIQQVFLEGYKYIGIDAEPAPGFPNGGLHRNGFTKIPFFRESREGKIYHVTRFPDQFRPDMAGDCFIANMSLGYGRLNATPTEVAAVLRAHFAHGYFRAQTPLQEVIQDAYDSVEIVRERCASWSVPLLYVCDAALQHRFMPTETPDICPTREN